MTSEEEKNEQQQQLGGGEESQPLPPPPLKTKPKQLFFTCTDCNLTEEYDYHGKSPHFCKSISFLEPSYITRDPFTSNSGNNANFLLLGSDCAVCGRMTCQECSVFFTRRFCGGCFVKVGSEFLPEELKKINKKK